MVDPISDMLTQIRNAQAVKKKTVTLSYSKLKMALAKVLKQEAYLKEIETIKEKANKSKLRQKFIKLHLSYTNDDPAIKGLKRVSKSGQRIYVSYRRIPSVLDGLGIAIISTPQGLMTGIEAKKKRLGGEVICEIW